MSIPHDRFVISPHWLTVWSEGTTIRLYLLWDRLNRAFADHPRPVSQQTEAARPASQWTGPDDLVISGFREGLPVLQQNSIFTVRSTVVFLPRDATQSAVRQYVVCPIANLLWPIWMWWALTLTDLECTSLDSPYYTSYQEKFTTFCSLNATHGISK